MLSVFPAPLRASICVRIPCPGFRPLLPTEGGLNPAGPGREKNKREEEEARRGEKEAGRKKQQKQKKHVENKNKGRRRKKETPPNEKNNNHNNRQRAQDLRSLFHRPILLQLTRVFLLLQQSKVASSLEPDLVSSTSSSPFLRCPPTACSPSRRAPPPPSGWPRPPPWSRPPPRSALTAWRWRWGTGTTSTTPTG